MHVRDENASASSEESDSLIAPENPKEAPGLVTASLCGVRLKLVLGEGHLIVAGLWEATLLILSTHLGNVAEPSQRKCTEFC